METVSIVMDKDKDYLKLKKFCLNEGVDLFGVADINSIKSDFFISEETMDRLDKAVCLGLRLSRSILEEIAQQPTRLYFHHYRATNNLLDQIALKTCNYIQKANFLALPIPASQILDWQNQKAHISHKKLGVLAGLGWIGRNNLLVNKKLGSQFRIVSVLTNMPLKTDEPVKDNCGSCRLCMAVCPADAIKEKSSDFDHIRCFEKLKEFQRQRLVDQYICGICLKACKGRQEDL